MIDRGPRFLYIGATRAGSTWLYRNLRQHPDLWVPPTKSVNYFHPRFATYRVHSFARFSRDMIGHPDPRTRAWHRHFYGRRTVDDLWYAALFPADRIAGEIAESYCSLDDSAVRRIRSLYPDLRVIITLRNPMERALSQAKYGLAVRRGRRTTEVPARDFICHLTHPSSLDRSDYMHMLDIWGGLFAERFMILFYELLREDPEGYFAKICRFVGAEVHADHFDSSLRAVVNRSSEASLPPEVVSFAARLYEAKVAALACRLGGPTITWLRDIEAIIAASTFSTTRLGVLPEAMGLPARSRASNRWWIKIVANGMYAAVAVAAMIERWRGSWGKVARLAARRDSTSKALARERLPVDGSVDKTGRRTR
jgi:Sulfotransferase family